MILKQGLSLEEVREIGCRNPLRIRVLCPRGHVYGYSGRCLFSNYDREDSNRGECAQRRYQYALMEAPWRILPVFEDEKGTYIMNSRDMCMIDHLGGLCAAGVSSLRSRAAPSPPYYCGNRLGLADAVGAGLNGVMWRTGVEHVKPPPLLHRIFLRRAGRYWPTPLHQRTAGAGPCHGL